MTDNEKLSAQMIRQIIGPLLQSFDKVELLRLLAMASLVADAGVEKIKDAIEKNIDSDDVSPAEVTFLALYALALAEEEGVTPQ